MERKANIDFAKNILQRNFIGPDELNLIGDQLNIPIINSNFSPVPNIPFTEETIQKSKDNYILILGIPITSNGNKLTLNEMRSHFGVDPQKNEPCFYNQDWYTHEIFANDTNLNLQWYLLQKNIKASSRGKHPDEILNNNKLDECFPTAILTAYTFFAFYFHSNGQLLWENDYVWCSDKDSNEDRIYTGRYIDRNGVSKNGFSIHRHLSIKQCYGSIFQIK